MAGRAPPGRAGRVWLAGRLDVAHRAVELLGHKQQLLRREEIRLAALADRTRREWNHLATEAQARWARVMVAGGSDDIRRLAPRVGHAQAELTWRTQAGVTYPSTATTRLPPPELAGDAAMTDALLACRRALDAAVRDAAASAALARVSAELAATTRRLRAIRDRWVPRLTVQLAEIDLRLDETDREEITRLRWTQHRESENAKGGQ